MSQPVLDIADVPAGVGEVDANGVTEAMRVRSVGRKARRSGVDVKPTMDFPAGDRCVRRSAGEEIRRLAGTLAEIGRE